MAEASSQAGLGCLQGLLCLLRGLLSRSLLDLVFMVGFDQVVLVITAHLQFDHQGVRKMDEACQVGAMRLQDLPARPGYTRAA